MIAQKQKALTMLEFSVVTAFILCIVLVILVVFKEVSKQARDVRRIQDIDQLVKFIHFYWADYGQNPKSTCPCGIDGWETSNFNSSQWMEYLENYLQGKKASVDPINKKVDSFSFFGPRSGHYFYAYTKYDSPPHYCPEQKRPFSVIAIKNLESFVLSNLPEPGMPLPSYLHLSRALCGDPGADGICTVAEYQAGQCRDWSQEFDYSIMLKE